MEDDDPVELPVEEKESSANSGIGSAISSIYGGATKIGSYVILHKPDLWPHMEKVDEMVKVITCAGYALGSFGVLGSVYFALRTARELLQWRAWMKFRKIRRR